MNASSQVSPSKPPVANLLSSEELASVGAAAIFFDHKLLEADSGVIVPQSLGNAVAKRRSEFIAGRICARNAMLQIGACNDFQVGIDCNRAPIWPQGLLGSITHSSGFAQSIVAYQKHFDGLGLDSEWLDTRKDIYRLKNQFSNHREQQILSAIGMPLAQKYYLLFSAKESIYKALYPSVKSFFSFEAFELFEFDQAVDHRGTMRFIQSKHLDNLCGNHLSEVRYTVESEWVHTLCLTCMA